MGKYLTLIGATAVALSLGGNASAARLLPANSESIPGSYIVVLHDWARGVDVSAEHGVTPRHRYQNALGGFSAVMPEPALIRLLNDPRVDYIEPDAMASIVAPPADKPGKPPNEGGGDGGDTTTCTQETPWGIARVGGAGDGTGKTAWVIDTGIDLDHRDLNVDVANSVNFANGKGADDGNGHGTHVAGTIAAIDNNCDVVGVAAGAWVVAVRVLGNSGSGSYSDVIAGVDHVAANANPGDVANMSLGGPASQALDDAVTDAADAGVLFALAAGNSLKHAGSYSPARVNHANVLTVSAIDSTDTFAYFSNYGNPPVDFAAPGVSILSTWKGGGTNTISGTSMASPHVAGLMLLSGTAGIKSDGAAKEDPDGDADLIAHQ